MNYPITVKIRVGEQTILRCKKRGNPLIRSLNLHFGFSPFHGLTFWTNSTGIRYLNITPTWGIYVGEKVGFPDYVWNRLDEFQKTRTCKPFNVEFSVTESIADNIKEWQHFFRIEQKGFSKQNHE